MHPEISEKPSLASEHMMKFPGIAEKFVVELSSSILVSKDHLRTKETHGWFSRIYEATSGKGHLRDIEIQKNLISGQEASIEWLIKLTEDHVRSNLALTGIQRAVNHIRESLAETVGFSIHTREHLQKLEANLDIRIRKMNARIQHLEVHTYVQRVLSKLEGGVYSELPFLSGIYAVLDELYWGEFGDYLRNGDVDNDLRQQHRDYLTNKLIALAKNRFGENRQPIAKWIEPSSAKGATHDECIAYLGTWADKDSHPFSFVSTQRTDALPLAMPLRLGASYTIDSMQREMFEDRPA